VLPRSLLLLSHQKLMLALHHLLRPATPQTPSQHCHPLLLLLLGWQHPHTLRLLLTCTTVRQQPRWHLHLLTAALMTLW
jgi:hypothetical protein